MGWKALRIQVTDYAQTPTGGAVTKSTKRSGAGSWVEWSLNQDGGVNLSLRPTPLR